MTEFIKEANFTNWLLAVKMPFPKPVKIAVLDLPPAAHILSINQTRLVNFPAENPLPNY